MCSPSPSPSAISNSPSPSTTALSLSLSTRREERFAIDSARGSASAALSTPSSPARRQLLVSAADPVSMEVEAVASAAPALPGAGDGAVRVVARIYPPSSAATTTAAPAPSAGTSLFQVAAARGRRPRASGPGAGATLSFTPAAPSTTSSSSSSQGRAVAAAGQRKEEHRLDWCYLQDEDNHQVFLHELHPILAHHLHNHTHTTAGSSACVVACGAAAAKDHLFKGSQEQPGLVTIAMEEILGFAESIGGAVRVSSYQVVQDTHVLDLLEPKEQEVLVLEDAQGKTHLKGLSKVHVKSIEDFAQLGCFDENQDKQQPTKASSTQQQPTKPFSTQPQPAKASSTQLPARGHQGLIIHISTSDQDGKQRTVAKINFLSLSDYMDPKQKTGGGAAALSSSGNKSMYTLMNVVQALNSNQSFVPYRQSKVTRILQDSLCKTSGAVVIACLEEVSCQDAVSTLSLAARSSQVATQAANEQCRRSTSVTSFKRADVNLPAVAKSSSRPILSSTHQPNPVVEKQQDRPQWNMSAVKAARTPIANKRSQPTMHSAKKSENSLPTPIKITQKAATPTMSGRSQPITLSAKKPESTVSPPTKMKQKDAKPAMSGRSQVMMRSAKKTESSLSASIKTKQKDAKPTATSGSTLLCPSTNSSKEEAAVIAPAATEVEEVQSSQGMEIDAPSTDEGLDKTSDALDTVPSEVQKVVSRGVAIDAQSTDEGLDKTSDALDTASSEVQKVVSSGMEEEDYSSSGLDAASSCTIDLGETCSPNIPDAFVEKTPVKTHMNTPKISDKLREISNSLKLLNARPLSVMAQKVAMEKTQEEGMEKTQKVAMEKTEEVAMETTQEVAMETTQEVAMETTQEEGMETTQGVALEKTQEEGMEMTEGVAMETTQEEGMETTQEEGMEMTQEVATGATQEEEGMETTQEVATGATQEEEGMETTQEVATGTTQEVAIETTQKVAVETTQVAVETAQEVAVETTQEVAVQTTQEVAAETTQEVAVETAQEVAVQTTQEIATETTRQEVGMEYVQGGTNIDAPEPKTPAMHLKFEQAADPKTPAMHLKFEQAADYPASSFKTRSTGIKKSILQECLSFLNSANKEQLKSLKGIGEKRANYIIELREHSPELFKGVDDLRDVIGMNKTEIKRMMSGIIGSP
ncbi:kinesin-like protein KIN-10B isoform X2 [Triticum dicoccoides]|uniref:kinesin-like protein KIN-10B isoform X2 n=1 Tax=Triticum dicoccoides TaxID=85692 RepID=UPI00188FB377|nr:kinesin-like protein KIN-10B isoform X2 [Triticum dicoccoides]